MHIVMFIVLAVIFLVIYYLFFKKSIGIQYKKVEDSSDNVKIMPAEEKEESYKKNVDQGHTVQEESESDEKEPIEEKQND